MADKEVITRVSFKDFENNPELTPARKSLLRAMQATIAADPMLFDQLIQIEVNVEGWTNTGEHKVIVIGARETEH